MDEQDDIKPDAAAVASATAAAADVHIEDANDDDQINVPVPSSDQEEHAQPPSPKITNPISVQLNKACKMEEGFDMDYKQEEDGDKKKDAGVGASSTGLLKGCNMDVTTPVWVKRKRTTRTVVSCDENTAADSLVFMKVCRTEPPQAGTETDQESCAESSGEEFLQENEEDDVKFDGSQQASSSQIVLYNPPSSSRQVFECSTCNKVFGSHQALGGHRASHKRIKGCFAGKATTSSTFRQTGSGAITKDDDTPVVETSARARKKNGGEKMHECSICLRRFSSGQALGGHKRCHWMSPNARESIPAPPLHRRHLPVKHSATLAPPPPRTTQTVEKRNTRTPPATITPTSSSSSMPNVTSASASASGSGSGGPSVNLSNLPCMDGVASDWLHLHVRRDSSVEPNDDRDDDDDDDENDGES